MKRRHLVYAALAALGLGGWGCSDSTNPITSPDPVDTQPVLLTVETPCGDPLTVDLVTRKRDCAGFVTIANDETTLSISIDTRATGWVLAKSELTLTIPGEGRSHSRRCFHKHARLDDSRVRHRPPVTEYTYDVSLAELALSPGDVVQIGLVTAVAMLDELGKPTRVEQAWPVGPNRRPRVAASLRYEVQACDSPSPCTLTVSAPNGGEFLCAGWLVDIRWDCEYGGPAVKIELLWDNQLCSTIAASAPNTGSYSWRASPCSPENYGYSIRVTDIDSGVADDSDGTFEIAECM